MYQNILNNGLRTKSIVNDAAGNLVLSLSTHESLGGAIVLLQIGGDQVRLTQAMAIDLRAALLPFTTGGLLT